MASLLEFGAQLASVYRKKQPVRDADVRLDPPSILAKNAQDDASLSKLVEREIIPRLVASHPIHIKPAARGDSDQITAEEVDGFAPLSLQVEADALLEYVEVILRRGVGIDALLVDLLAPAARRLGEYWEDDRCDFVDVTMGLWRLQEIVHELSARLPIDRQVGPGRRALFSSLMGDQHSFGTVVIEELFSREGWLTDRMSEASTPDLLERVAGEWFDLIGLTITCDYHIAPLPSVIATLRNVSRNPRLCVMVGGRIFVEDPDLAVRLGADGTAPDAKVAVQVAVDLVDTLISAAAV
ncbi:B12-binding domain-containing protein [Sphingomonas sp. 28-63-12]|uniref:cobalamin B12-binding domain-containing protein n=1 Tax=Sphingomonas sp. 28-63-12 TaxID=1970434 RepID=UPI000BD0DF88|nr:MAG: cobalamin-binding protein [Sphingomonas sp. 28-63-12]